MNPRRFEFAQADPGQDSILRRAIWSMIQRRWYLLVLVVFVSCGLSYWAAQKLRQEEYRFSATLLHTGLPSGMAAVYQPLSVESCQEILVSTPVMSKLKESEGLGMPAKALARCFEVESSYRSDLLTIHMKWAELKDGIRMLEALLSIFREEIIRHRNQTLEDQIVQMEQMVLDARAEMDQARQLLDGELARQNELAGDGASASGDRARALGQLSVTESQRFEQEAVKRGFLQQRALLEEDLARAKEKVQSVLKDVRDAVLTPLEVIVANGSEQFARQSTRRTNLEAVLQEFSKLKQEEIPVDSYRQWTGQVQALVKSCAGNLSPSDMEQLSSTLVHVFTLNEDRVNQAVASMNEVAGSLNALRLKLIPIDSKLQMLADRLKVQQAEFEKSGAPSQFSGASALARSEAKYEEAKRQYQRLADQVSMMRQLQTSGLQEWKVAVAPSAETAEVSTTTKKIFVAALALCLTIGCAPLVLVECLREWDPPQLSFARSVGLTMVGELQNQKLLELPAEIEDDAIRMLALKIQQSISRPGAVAVFSSVDEEGIGVPVLAPLAKCLAARGEQVLLVDAVCPQRSNSRLTNHFLPLPSSLTSGEGKRPNARSSVADSRSNEANAEETYGLSELLSSPEDCAIELVRRSDSPNIDVVDRGSRPFPNEAMASTRLSNFIAQCQKKYSIILVHGPGVAAPVDMQMMAARADVICLVASKKVKNNRRAKEAIEDLVALGAPILGVVSI